MLPNTRSWSSLKTSSMIYMNIIQKLEGIKRRKESQDEYDGDKTSSELGDALNVLLAKKGDKKCLNQNMFKISLKKLVIENDLNISS